MLEVDPSLAVAGWLPLAITLAALVALYGLFRAMKHNVRMTDKFVPQRDGSYVADEPADDTPATTTPGAPAEPAEDQSRTPTA